MGRDENKIVIFDARAGAHDVGCENPSVTGEEHRGSTTGLWRDVRGGQPGGRHIDVVDLRASWN